MEQLRNDRLQVEMCAKGAELMSIKDMEGREYLWQGDSKYWGRRSPILFPIVGRVWQNRYRAEGKTWEMSQHGILRDAEFKLVNKTDNRVTYAYTDTPETLRQYPYHFMLSITYKLVDNNIEVIWQVLNTDTREIHFQIGGHPAFNLVDANEQGRLCGTIKLDTSDTLHRQYCTTEGCRPEKVDNVETENGYFSFTDAAFDDDAMIFTDSQIREASLLDSTHRPLVTLNFRSPALGIWMPKGKNAPFVCIEPWYGVTDSANYTGEFKDRTLMNHLQPGASFLSKYTITIK